MTRSPPIFMKIYNLPLMNIRLVIAPQFPSAAFSKDFTIQILKYVFNS